METALIVASAAVALAAAVRSTWSPCGLSMLSTITPVAERARGHRYRVTATWFVAGAVLGGATLGLATAGLAALVGAAGVTATAACALALPAGALAVASDLRVPGFRIPGHTRQVDDAWLAQFRPWVYGAGFGWQIGVGLATYIMTSGVYLMILLAALTGEPMVALAIITGFGLVRGLAVLLGARLTTPASVFAFHRRFDRVGPVTRAAMITVEAAATGALAWVVGGPFALVPLALFGGAILLTVRVPVVRATAP